MADVKKGETVVLAGTKKGLFILHSRDRKKWKSRGPFMKGWPVRHAVLDTRDHKTVWAGTISGQWGPGMFSTKNFGGKMDRIASPHYSKESGLSVEGIWQIQAGADGNMYAGVEPAGLFRSTDEGKTWDSVEGLNARPERKDWQAGNGGLILHTILPYPKAPNKMVIGISSVGIMGTKDGGKSWKIMNGGVHSVFEPNTITKDGEIGTCPHKIVRDGADPRVLYMQNHAGVYRRTEGDDAWKSTENGLPKWRVEKGRRWTFGFPIAAHPHNKGWAYLLPLEGDGNRVTKDGSVQVYRTKDGAKSWQKVTKGLPQKGAYYTILRDGMRTDTNDPAGVYFGTETGELFASRNEGDSWEQIADNLPPVLSVEAGVVGG